MAGELIRSRQKWSGPSTMLVFVFVFAFGTCTQTASAQRDAKSTATEPVDSRSERPTTQPILRTNSPATLPATTTLPKTRVQTTAVKSPFASMDGMSPELQNVIREIVLGSIPHTYEDKKKWGQTKGIVSGLDMKLDGFKLRTQRRRKEVNHGTWTKYEVQLVDPQQKFQLKIDRVEMPASGRFTFRATVETPLKATARVQEWNRGVRLMSVTTDAVALVNLAVDCALEFETLAGKFPPDIQLKPEVTAADINVKSFQVHRISHVKGTIAKEMGRNLRRVLDRQIIRKREKLPAKINRSIAKNKDKLRIPLGKVMSSKWGQLLNPFADKSAADKSNSSDNDKPADETGQ